LIVGFKWPLIIAFLTASVNDENEATCWIGLFVIGFGKHDSSADDLFGNDVDDEVLIDSDKCFILRSGVQCFGISCDKVESK